MSEPEPTSAAPAPEASRPGRIPRRPFPLARVLVGFFGIAVAGWLWLGSGWRWGVTPKRLLEGRPPVGLRTWVGRYVRLGSREPSLELTTIPETHNMTCLSRVGTSEDGTASVWARYSVAEGPVLLDPRSSFSGRVAGAGGGTRDLILDTTRGRMNVTSVAAVLIALWGAALIYFNLVVRRYDRDTRRPSGLASLAERARSVRERCGPKADAAPPPNLP